MVSKNNKKMRKKHYLGVKEFLFNFISLVFMIGVGLYFGYRSLYYYSKLNKKDKAEAQTLNGMILQHTHVVGGEENGLHHDSLGYYYKGNVDNNYVKFSNRIFRIIRIYEDNSVQLISDDYVGVFPWGEDYEYSTSNVYHWLDKTGEEHSGVYYNTIPKIENYLNKMNYQLDKMIGDKMTPSDINYEGYVTLLRPSDYILAGGKNSYLNNGKFFFLLGLSEDNDNLYVDPDGNIQTCFSTEGYGIRPVVTLKSNTIIGGGNGTSSDPYIIYQGGDTNYITSYVKLGDELWRVFYQDDKNLQLSLNGYGLINGEEARKEYYYKVNAYLTIQYTSLFDVTDIYSIGHYLNNNYYNSLSYKDKLIDFPIYTGEVSDDKGHYFRNIYTQSVNAKIGLLNVFDYMVNTTLEDYYRVNTTSEYGTLEYNSTKDGRLYETDVSEVKHFVPVVSIPINKIASGTGSINDPYIVG